MNTLAEYSQFFEEKLQQQSFPNQPENLYDPLRYFMTLGGKRLRPLLTLMGAELFGIHAEQALPAAIAVEYFHNFSLIHDDIMDEAPLRRTQPTIHTKWNLPIAILSGDVLLVKAYQEIAKQNPDVIPSLLDLFNRTAVEVCEGQQLDMDFEKRSSVHQDEYIEMIRLKTSVLLGCALEMGAIVAHASKEDCENLYLFGVEIGVAFQIQDDILDLYADPDKFGKQVGGDVMVNKKTLLLLKAFELANEAQTEQLNRLLLEKDVEKKVKEVRQLFDLLEVRSAAKLEMEKHYQKAMIALEAIQTEQEKKKPLLEMAHFLFHREN